jgi:hypothetical protein
VRTWEDVYAVKTYDYLEIIVKGGEPVWDKDKKTYVDKASLTESTEDTNELHNELTMGVETVKANIKTATKTSEPVAATESEDDLPF